MDVCWPTVSLSKKSEPKTGHETTEVIAPYTLNHVALILLYNEIIFIENRTSTVLIKCTIWLV